jgi:hypothetical protein
MRFIQQLCGSHQLTPWQDAVSAPHLLAAGEEALLHDADAPEPASLQEGGVVYPLLLADSHRLEEFRVVNVMEASSGLPWGESRQARDNLDGSLQMLVFPP